MIRKTLGKSTNQARETYFGFQGELVYDLLTNNLYIMDGQTAGGHLLSELMLPDNMPGYLFNDGDGNLSWQHLNTNQIATVESVAGRTGNVELTTADIAGLSTVAQSGSYNDLNNAPEFSTVATSGDYRDLSNLPGLANVATSGSYLDLIDTPNVFINLTSVNQDIIPDQDVTRNLGNATNQWHSLYVGPGSVYIGNVKLTNSNGSLVTTQISIDPTTGNETVVTNNTVIADKLTSGIYIASLEPDFGTLSLPGAVNIAHDSQYNLGNSSAGFNAIHVNSIKSRSTLTLDAGSTYSYWYNLFGDLSNNVNFDFGMTGQYDGGGNLITFGQHFVNGFNGGIIDTLALKYNPEGDLLWRKSWVTPGGNPCGSANVTFRIGDNGEIFWISAEQPWGDVSVPDFFYAGTTDADGVISNAAVQVNNVYVYSMTLSNNTPVVVGQGFVNGNTYPVITQVNIDNHSLDWTTTFISDLSGYFADITIDNAGYLWTIGSATDPDTGFPEVPIYKINPANGTLINQWVLKHEIFTLPQPITINRDSGNFIYTVLMTNDGNGHVLSKWTNYMDPVWATSFNDGFNIQQILFDNANNLYVIGQNSNTILVAAINQYNGSFNWQRQIIPSTGYVGPFETSVRSADVYQDRIGITAIFTENPLNDNSTLSAFTIQLPIDGSLIGTFGQFTIAPSTFVATLDVNSSSSDYAPSVDFTNYYDTIDTQFVPDTILHDTGEWPYRYELKGGKLNQSSWQFTTDGRLISPTGGIFGPAEGSDSSSFGLQIVPDSTIQYSEINYKNNQYFYMYDDGIGFVSNAQHTGHTWFFDNSGVISLAGNIRFADNTIQTTAATGIATTSNLTNNSFRVSLDSTGNLAIPKNITMTRGSYITSEPGYVGNAQAIANIAIAAGNTVVITTDQPHGLASSNKIKITNITTTTQLNDHSYYTGNVSSYNATLYVDSSLHTPVDGGSFSPYISRGNRTMGESGVTYSRNNPFSAGALAFTGTQWLTLQTSDLSTSGDFTAECWVYSTTGFGYDGIFNLDGIITIGTDNISNLWFRDGSGSIITGPQLDSHTWYHIAVVRIGSTVEFYLNGTGFHSSSNSDTFDGNFTFAKGVIGNGQNLRGYMTGIRFSHIAKYLTDFTPAVVYSTADSDTLLLINCLTSANAFVNSGTLGGSISNQQTVNGTHTTSPANTAGIVDPTTKLDFYYAAYVAGAFNIPVGATVTVTGTDNFTDTVTLIESPDGETRFDLFFTLANHSGPFANGDALTFTWMEPVPTFAYQTPYSVISGSMDLHLGLVSFANAQELAPGTGDFTLELWIFANSWNGFSPIFQASNQFQLQISNTQIFNGVGSAGIGYTLETNKWYYITIVRTGGLMLCWINGNKIFISEYGYNLTYDPTLPSSIGSVDGSTTPFDGLISNLRYVNGAALYSADSIAVPTQPFTAISGTKLLLTSAGGGGYYSDSSHSMQTSGGGQLVAEYRSGDLTLEAGAVIDEDAGNINITSGSNTWIFNGSTGGLIFPDNTVQLTATDRNALKTDFVGLNLNDQSSNVYIGSPGDQTGTIKIDSNQRSYISTRDYIGTNVTVTTVTVTTIEDVTTGQTGGNDTVVFNPNNYSNIKAIVGDSLQYFTASEWTVHGTSLAGTYTLTNAGVGGGNWSFFWTHHSGDPDPVTTGTTFTLTHTSSPRNPEIWKQLVTGTTWDNNHEKIDDISIFSSRDVTIQAGSTYYNNNVTVGGSVGIYAGSGNVDAQGGSVWITSASGTATGGGGDVNIWAAGGGYYAGGGGNLNMTSGSASGSNSAGIVNIYSGQGSGNTNIHTASPGGPINIFSGSGAYILENTVIENIILNTPVAIQITAHGLNTGQKVYINNITTTSELNDKSYYIYAIDADHILLFYDTNLRKPVSGSGLTPYQNAAQYSVSFQNVISGATDQFGLFSSASADLSHLDLTWTVSGDTIGNNVPITGISAIPNGGGAGITLFIIAASGNNYYDQGYNFVLKSAITDGGGSISAATPSGNTNISTANIYDPRSSDQGYLNLSGTVTKNNIPLETADSNWVDPNENTWGIRTYNGGTAFSFNSESSPIVWWDAANTPVSPAPGGTGFHGAIIEYQAIVNGHIYGTIIGTIQIATQDINSNAVVSHSETIDSNIWPKNTSFWEVNGTTDNTQLLFNTTLPSSDCTVRIMWTSRVFYQEENFC